MRGSMPLPSPALASVLALLIFLGAALEGSAEPLPDEGTPVAEDTGGSAEPLTIATRHVPPFAIRGADGGWSGIAIELWEQIARQLDLDYRYVDLSLTAMLDAVAEGRADGAVAALTITAERESRIDFSHPYLTSGLGIAVHQHPSGGMAAVLKRLFSGQFLGVVAVLLALLAGTGALVWVAERRRNGLFSDKPAAGIGTGLWWSAQTMTTVGYGDTAPVTPLGRLIALIWMFSGVVMVSGFTAAMTTALTVGQLDQPIKGVEDLYNARVLTLAGSTSERFLAALGIRHEALPSMPEALAQVERGQADAVVYDAPILRWHIAEEYPGRLQVLPQVLQRQDYGIALPQGSPRRESVNTRLLEIIRGEDWQPLLSGYLGQAG